MDKSYWKSRLQSVEKSSFSARKTDLENSSVEFVQSRTVEDDIWFSEFRIQFKKIDHDWQITSEGAIISEWSQNDAFERTQRTTMVRWTMYSIYFLPIGPIRRCRVRRSALRLLGSAWKGEIRSYIVRVTGNPHFKTWSLAISYLSLLIISMIDAPSFIFLSKSCFSSESLEILLIFFASNDKKWQVRCRSSITDVRIMGQRLTTVS